MTQNEAYGENVDISKYYIQPTDGGRYIAYAYMNQELSDPGYTPTAEMKDYNPCGPMTRWGDKYGTEVGSWSIDSILDSREGRWQNNLTEDYEYLYEYLCGKLPKGPENIEKYKRLYERKFLGEKDEVQVIVAKNGALDVLPKFSPELKEKLAAYAGRNYELEKHAYPVQMHDLLRDESRYVLTSSMPIMHGAQSHHVLGQAARISQTIPRRRILSVFGGCSSNCLHKRLDCFVACCP